MRQERQPFTQQRVDLGRAKGLADRLQGGRVIDSGEGVVQRGEAEAGLGRLALSPLVAVDAFPELRNDHGFWGCARRAEGCRAAGHGLAGMVMVRPAVSG
jgi:hypothetical protein